MPTTPAFDIELTTAQLDKVPRLMVILQKAINSQDDTLQHLNRAATEYQKTRAELPNGNDAQMKKVAKELDDLYLGIRELIPVLQDHPSEQGRRRLVYPIVRASNNLAGHLRKVEKELFILDISKRYSYLADLPIVRQRLVAAVDEYKKNMLSHINDPLSQKSAEKKIRQEGKKFAAKVDQVLEGADRQVRVDRQAQRDEWRRNLSPFARTMLQVIVFSMIIPMIVAQIISNIIESVVTAVKTFLQPIKNEKYPINKTTFFKYVVPKADQDSVLQHEEALKQGENPMTPKEKNSDEEPGNELSSPDFKS